MEFSELGSVCNIKTGQSVNKIMIEQNKGEYPVINSGKDPLGYINIYNTENDPIGITSRGAGVGSITWYEGKYFRGNLNYSVTVIDKNILNFRYLYFILMNSQKQINELSVFNGIPALNANSLIKLKIPIPPIAIQEEIVKILNSFTELEAELKAELKRRKKQYKYYRNELLTGSKNFKVKNFEKLIKDKIVVTILPPKKLTKKYYQKTGKFPIVDQGQNLIVGYTNDQDSVLEENECVIFGDHTEAIKYINFTFAQGADGIKILKTDSKLLNAKYLYYALNVFYKKTGKYTRHFSFLKKCDLLIPPLPEQERIVSILDKFDTLVNDISIGLPAELKARRSQYEYYRGKLLTFNELKIGKINKT
ncbi:MAG: restriction endonuclease subunit S [Candidatus Gracilibacteria bacterium]|nr:restriction endonuclease subunit S [Candidatus Gracilibacteria bacterium]